jgi:hypothetical protein
MMFMDKILDLDLDYFVWPIAHNRAEEHGRPPARDFDYIASEEQVRQFLEDRCGLSTSNKLRGAEFVEHVDAFWTWDRWIREGKISTQFEVAHVDAHADLGVGWNDSSWVHLLIDLLGLPLEKRNQPKTGGDGLHSGSYLAFAIGNRWISRAKYVYPIEPPWLAPVHDPNDHSMEAFVRRMHPILHGEPEDDGCPSDVMALYFRNEDPSTGMIELPHFTPEQKDQIFLSSDLHPAHTEPPMPFECIHGDTYSDSGFTHIVVAQSPIYLPESADKLMAIVREYFDPV